MKIAAEFLSGNRPLAEAFWILWIFGSMLFGFAVVLLLDYGLGWLPDVSLILAAIGFLLMVVYQIFCLVAVWMCAKNVNARVWTVLSRVLVVLFAIQLTLLPFQAKEHLFGPPIDFMSPGPR